MSIKKKVLKINIFILLVILLLLNQIQVIIASRVEKVQESGLFLAPGNYTISPTITINWYENGEYSFSYDNNDSSVTVNCYILNSAGYIQFQEEFNPNDIESINILQPGCGSSMSGGLWIVHPDAYRVLMINQGLKNITVSYLFQVIIHNQAFVLIGVPVLIMFFIGITIYVLKKRKSNK